MTRLITAGYFVPRLRKKRRKDSLTFGGINGSLTSMKHYYVNLRDDPHKLYQLIAWLNENSFSFFITQGGLLGIPHLYNNPWVQSESMIKKHLNSISCSYETCESSIAMKHPYSVPTAELLSSFGELLFL